VKATAPTTSSDQGTSCRPALDPSTYLSLSNHSPSDLGGTTTINHVPDTRPPRLTGGERETLVGLLRFQRESLVRKVTGVGDAAARSSPVGSGTTLLWLVKHLAGAEVSWLVRRFAGQDVPWPDETVTPEDTVTSAIEGYRAAWRLVDPVLDGADLDDLARRTDGQPAVNLRWILAHLLEETARHAGHADILRELIDGETGR